MDYVSYCILRNFPPVLVFTLFQQKSRFNDMQSAANYYEYPSTEQNDFKTFLLGLYWKNKFQFSFIADKDIIYYEQG